MRKKGSLQLSVNAIVVLVLAITMLGIGISFTRGLFNDIKFETTVDLSDPTFDDPWSIPSRELSFAVNGDTRINVKFRNTASFTFDIVPEMMCNVDEETRYLLPITTESSVRSGGVEEYYLVFKGDKIEDAGFVAGQIYPCKFVACSDSDGTGPQLCFNGGIPYSSKPFLLNAKTA